MAATMAAAPPGAASKFTSTDRPAFRRQGSGSFGSDGEELDTIDLDVLHAENNLNLAALPSGASGRSANPADGPASAAVGALPPLLREWSYPSPFGEGQRTADSGPTQSEGGIQDYPPPPPPPPLFHNDALADRDAADTAGGGTAAAGAAGVGSTPPPPPPLLSLMLPALQIPQTMNEALQQSPPAVRAVRGSIQRQLDRAVTEHGPVVSKMLTNSICQLRRTIDHVSEHLGVDEFGNEEDPAEDGFLSDDRQGLEGVDLQTEEDISSWILVDDDYINAQGINNSGHEKVGGKYHPSEYDDQDDAYEAQLMQRHGRGCISKDGGRDNTNIGPFRRVRKWVRRRRECFVENRKDKHQQGGEQDGHDDDMATVHTVASSLSAAASSMFAGEDDDSELHNVDHLADPAKEYDSYSSDGGCGFRRNHKGRGQCRGKKWHGKKNRHGRCHRRRWGRSSRNNNGNNHHHHHSEESAYHDSSSSGGEDNNGPGTNATKKSGRKKRRMRRGRNNKGKGIPAAPRANLIFRGAPTPRTNEPPAPLVRFVGYGNDDDDGASSMNRSRTYSSPAALSDAVHKSMQSPERNGALVGKDPVVAKEPKDRLEAERAGKKLLEQRQEDEKKDEVVPEVPSDLQSIDRRRCEEAVVPAAAAAAPSMDRRDVEEELEEAEEEGPCIVGSSVDDLLSSIDELLGMDVEDVMADAQAVVVPEVDFDAKAKDTCTDKDGGMLDFDREREVLESSLRDARELGQAEIDLDFQTATTDRLGSYLATGEAQVLHFVCHGSHQDTDAAGIEDDWVMVPTLCPVDPYLVDPPEPSHSIKVVFLSSPRSGADKSALVDSLVGIPRRPTSRSSTRTLAIRSLLYTPDLKMSLWDVPAGHQGQAPLAYSSNTVYVVVYDMGVGNPKTNVRKCSDAFDAEKATRAANRALVQDVDDNVRSFATSIERSNVRGCVVLPLLLADPALPLDEEERRRGIIEDRLTKRNGSAASIRFARSLVVDDMADLGPLKKEIVFNASPSDSSTTDECYQEVRQVIRRAKEHRSTFIAVESILDSTPSASRSQVQSVLEAMASSGDVLYFRAGQDKGLVNEYVILDIKFFFSAVACVVRHDFKQECHAISRGSSLSEVTANCPIISTADVSLLWQSMAFIRDTLSSASSTPASPEGFYEYLKQVLVQRGVFVSLAMNGSTFFLVPSLLRRMPEDAFTYKTPESWRTVLCHSWLVDSNVAKETMESAATSLVQDMFNSSDFVPHLHVYQVLLWQSALFLRIGPTHGNNTIDILCHLVDDGSSNLSVASESTKSTSTRIVVSARGQAGDGGRYIWGGGFRAVIRSLDAAISTRTEPVHCEIICPECLAGYHPSSAGTWSKDVIEGARSHAFTRCLNGHELETAMLSGRQLPSRDLSRRNSRMHDEDRSLHKSASSVNSILGGVVVVGLYNEEENKIERIGSGFVADKERGLIITASHVLFDMTSGSNRFGQPYYAFPRAKAVIGVLPNTDGPAVFRYFAEILFEDVCNVDACVLRITTRFDADVQKVEDCAMQPERPVSGLTSAFRDLQQLKLTKKCELEESIRILGYNQGGEGVLPVGHHINRYPDFAKGYVCKKFKVEEEARHIQTENRRFAPLEETVAICPTIDGHSGGPVVNASGSVIGILSRADHVDSARCYLVPSTELRRLLKKAKKACQLTPLELYHRMKYTSSNV